MSVALGACVTAQLMPKLQAILSVALSTGATSPQRLLGAEGPDLTRYFLVCGILLAAICALAFGFKKLVAGALRSKAAGRALQIVDVLPLGGKQKLAVVRCYDRTFALGLGEKEVALIAELDPVNTESVPADGEPSVADRKAFSRALDRARSEPLASQAPPAGRTGIARRMQQLLKTGGVLG